ncbi:urea transporter [Pedobacter nyackensis]|uniref:Urea transporter n=1 Tax=Pedobacter nyackensis TaxID=475255 RepID=A0A1W2ENM9_9SPHI|nr:urea transporter [Pedobacter nyackensis]SMD10728.1 urea transporter [Pedobacter nyackensis]
MKEIEQRFPFILAVLKGIGQIMLQENAITGILFLAGIFYGSIFMGLGAILAGVCGTMTAKALQYNREEIQQGLYGFSAALVGVALPFYFEPVVITWVAVVVGSMLATIIQHFFIVKKIPVFTLPFVLVTWILLYIFYEVYPVPTSALLNIKTNITYDFSAATKGFGQVIFQGSLFAGIAFFIGVFINAPISALYALAASIFGGMIAMQFAIPAETIEMGLFGYNAVLCAIFFAGDRVRDGIWVGISVALTLAIGLLMSAKGLTQLTFPFVAATCITLLLKNKLSASAPSN